MLSIAKLLEQENGLEDDDLTAILGSDILMDESMVSL